MAYKGKFKPKNPDKYKGNPADICYRSSWELKFMLYLDTNPNILSWSSEEIIVPYISPIDGKKHRYFPDFIVKKISSDNTIKTVMIEIKPEIQTNPPKLITENMTTRQRNRIKRAKVTYAINMAKWEAAQKYCLEKNMEFVIMTENHLGIKNKYTKKTK